MKIMIVGGSGFLGSFIADELEMYDVCILDFIKNKKHKTIIGNILNLDFLVSSFKDYEAVIHVAAITSRERVNSQDIINTNVVGTFNVHEAARIVGINKVISTSSESIYGYFGTNVSLANAPKILPITESAAPNPKSIYAFSKVQSEYISIFYANIYQIITTIIRPPWIASPIDYDIHHGFINGGREGGGGRKQSVFPFNCFNTHAWVDVRDLARAYRIILEKNNMHNIYNICSDDSTLNFPLKTVYPNIKAFQNFTDRASALSNNKIKKLGFIPKYNRSIFI